MNGALLLVASLSASQGLGYEGVNSAGGAVLELKSRSERTEFRTGLLYHHAPKQISGGYALSGQASLRRFIGDVLVELGASVVQQRAPDYTKTGAYPFIGIGVRWQDYLARVAYDFADGTENETHGVRLLLEMNRWSRLRPYATMSYVAFKDLSGTHQTGTSVGLGIEYRSSNTGGE